MIRFVFRSLGFVLTAAAFATLVVDGSRSIAGGRVLFSSLGDAAAWLGWARAAEAVARWPGPAGEAAAGVLAAPAWIVAVVIGLLLLRAGQPSPGGVGFSRRRT